MKHVLSPGGVAGGHHAHPHPSARFKRGLNAVVALSDAGDSHEEPVLVPGTWNGVPLTASVLDELAQTYNPDAQPAPIKQTHEDKGPGLGWVGGLRTGDWVPPGQSKPRKTLFAKFKITDALRKAKDAGFRMKSCELWPPDQGNNPTKGRWHFKGLALLGAQSPACPNLTPLSFSDQDTEVEIPVLMLADEALSNPGGQLPPHPQGDPPMALTPEQQAELEKQNKELAVRNKTLETQLADQKKASETTQVQARLDGLIKDRKLTPAEAKMLLPVALALDPEEATVQLADKTRVPLREALFRTLGGLKEHHLDQPSRIPGTVPEEEVELASRKGTKAFDDRVKEYMKSGKSRKDALAMACRDFEDEPAGEED